MQFVLSLQASDVIEANDFLIENCVLRISSTDAEFGKKILLMVFNFVIKLIGTNKLMGIRKNVESLSGAGNKLRASFAVRANSSKLTCPKET